MKENHSGSINFPERLFYLFFLLCIFVIAIFIRLPYVFVQRLWPDEALYAWAAKRIFSHPELIFSKEISDFHPPLFPALLSFWHFFFPPLVACHWMVFVTNVLGIIAVYFLGKKIQGWFLGVFAAMALAFNPQYFIMSSLILNDGVLAVSMIIFFYILAEIHQRQISRPDFYLGIMVIVLILLKWSGGLVLPFLFFYYLLAFPDFAIRERLRKMVVPITLAIVLVGILLWHNYMISGDWIPKVFRVSNNDYRYPFFYYCYFLKDNIISVPFVPFFIFGLWNSLQSDNRNQWAQGFWVIFAFLVVSAMPNKDIRFILPLLPSIVLVTGMGIEAFLLEVEKVIISPIMRPMCLMLIFLFFAVFTFPFIEQNMISRAYGYVGFQEAGVYLKKEIVRSPDTLVLASSPRIIRYYSDINFIEFGGNLSCIPENEADFINIIRNASSDVILIIDAWEWAQPKWIFSSTDSNNKIFKELGFHLERIIDKDVRIMSDKFAKRTVVWISKRYLKGR